MENLHLNPSKKRIELNRNPLSLVFIWRMGIITNCFIVFLIAGSFRTACYSFFYSYYCDTGLSAIADNMYQRSELDYLIYNDPAAYAELILNGDPEAYLKAVTEYKPLDS